MKVKKLIFLCLFILILSIASVSASEDTNQTLSISNIGRPDAEIVSVSNGENITLTENENNDVLTSENNIWYVNESQSGGSGETPENAFKTLKDAITASENGDSIMIASGLYTGSENINLEISKQLNLIKYGNGEAVFDAQGNSRIFIITATHFNITGLTFKNGKEESGGAIYYTNTMVNELIYNINAIFINNTATRHGGANYFQGKLINSTINGTYINNIAGHGGANSFSGQINGLTIDGTYTNNTGKMGGGVTFMNILSSDFKITGTYEYNQAKNGGVNYISGLDMANSTITGSYSHNTATQNGGVNYIEITTINTTITGSYSHNTATQNGGAIYFNKVGVIKDLIINGTYMNNNATNGGVCYLDRSNTMIDLTITGTYMNNKAQSSLIIIENENIENGNMENAIFLNNDYDKDILDSEGSFKADNCWFGLNATNYKYYNPYKYVNWNHVSADNTLFLNGTYTQNKVKFFLMSYNEKTGDITEYDNKLLPKIDLILYANNATLKKNHTTFDKEVTCRLNGNSETGNITAQAMNWEYAKNTIEIKYGIFDSLQQLINDAEENSVINLESNLIYNKFDTITEGVLINKNITINGNGHIIDAKGKTRIFKVTAKSINITNITLQNGKTPDNGGAIYFINEISNSNINATYINNTAKNGGASYFMKNVINSDISGTYTNNSAADHGGANYYSRLLNSNINGTYTNNSAKNGGANYIINNVTNSTISGTYTNNSAANNGGANYIDTLTNSNITGTYLSNRVKREYGNGGANNILKPVVNSTITGTYTNNIAFGGGANNILKPVVNSTITGTYTNNTANYGGANFIQDTVTNTTISGTYTNNTANNRGANYFIGNVINSDITGTYTNNTANYGGANYFAENVINSDITGTYTNNTATGTGGANYFYTNVINSNITGTYHSNRAKGNSGKGGANYFYTNVINSNINGTYINNSAANNGGANYIQDTVTNTTISGTYINSRAMYGGAIYIDAENMSKLTISGTYINNTVTENNAIINIRGKSTINAEICNGIFLNNKGEYEINADKDGAVANNNWFGNNATNYQDPPNVGSKIKMDTWLYLNGTADQSKFKFYLMSYNSTSNTKDNYDNTLVGKVNLTVTSTNITVNKDYALLDKSIGLKIISLKNASITAQIENAKYTISMDDEYTFEIETENITYGSSETIRIILPDDVKLTAEDIVIKINNIEYKPDITDNVAKVVLFKPVTDTYDVNVTFKGKDTYYAKNKSATFNVSQNSTYNLKINVEVKEYGQNMTINVNAPTDLQNNITIKIDNNEYSVKPIDGVATLTLNNLSGGYHSISATAGDKNYQTKTNNTSINVPKTKNYPANLTIENNNAILELPEDATGNATLYINNKKYKTANITGNKTTIPLPKLDPGNYTIKATYNGNENYLPKTLNTTLNIPKISNYTANLTTDKDNNAILELPKDATGNATLYINNKKYKTVNITGSKTTIPLPKLDPGNYTIKVIYSGNDKYAPKTLNTTTNIPKINNYTANLTIDKDNNIILELPEDATGNTTLYINGKETKTVPVTGSKTIIPTELEPGNYTITTTYNGNNKYTPKTLNTTTNIKKDGNYTINTIIDDNNNIIVELPKDATGNITATTETEKYNIPIQNGKATIPTSNLEPGNHTIEIQYPGDNKYTAKSTTTNLNIPKIDNYTANLTTDKDNNIILELPEDATGNTTLYINGKKTKTVNITGSKTILLTELNPGNYTIKVIYNGNNKYTPKTLNTTINIPKINNYTINTTIDKNNNIIVELPKDATGNITATTETEKYNIPIQNGKATIPTSNLKPGTYTINITYPGNEKYTAKNTTTTINIPKINNYTAKITIDKNNNIILELPEDATGNATLYINNKKYKTVNITGSKTTIPLPKLDPGNYTIKVTYNGNDKYTPKTLNTTTNIPKINNYTAKITIKDNNAILELPQDATGNTTLYINGKKTKTVNITGSKTIIPLPELNPGNYTIKVTYNGNNKYTPKTLNTTTNIPKINNYTAKITTDKNNNIILELPEDATGNITTYINGKEYKTTTVTGSKTTIPLPELDPGNYTITATYNGNNKYTPKTLNTTLNIAKINNYTADINIGEDSVTVTLPEDINGNLTVEVGNETFTVPINNGVAVIPYDDLPAGENSITVTYPGNDKYAEKSFDFNVTVEPKVIITVKDLIKYYGSPDRFIVNITDSKGTPIASTIVYITLNGQTYNRTTDNNGIASIGVNLNSGNYMATVSVNETELTATISVLSTINGTNIVKIFHNATQYYVTALDSNGNYLPENTEIELNINGVFYKRKVTGDKGLVKLNINLEPNTYIITARNTVTGEIIFNNITVLSRLTENKNITMYEKNGTKYTVRVLDETGKAVGAGEKVTFNINGVFYTRTTDSNGYASLNLNLNPGNYIITAMYGDSTVANNIEILPRLVASDLIKKYGTPDQFKAQLLDGKGKPITGEKVIFNINGVLYNRPTDADGFAKLNINLMPGKYVITSSYGSFVCGNTVTVNA